MAKPLKEGDAKLQGLKLVNKVSQLSNTTSMIQWNLSSLEGDLCEKVNLLLAQVQLPRVWFVSDGMYKWTGKNEIKGKTRFPLPSLP